MKAIDRRVFLKAAAATVAGRAAMPETRSQETMEPLEGVVDCHFHLWAADKKRFPYQPNPPYAPGYANTAEQWESNRKGAGIAYGISVSGAPYGDDPSFLYHSLKQAPEALRGVCLINPNTEDGVAELERTVEGRNIVGVRLQTSWLWGVDWDSPHLAAFWKRLGERDLVLQMHLEPEWNPRLSEMVERFPGTRVVIDHLGRPRNGNAIDFMLLTNIARHSHVYIKLSSFDTESEQEPPYPKIRPVVKELVEWFTPRRCVWGSNSQREMDSEAYLEQINQARRLVDFLSVEEHRLIFCENPRRLYGLG